MLSAVLRTVAAGALASAATVLLPASPAAAEACGSSTGVTVVADFSAFPGGGIATTCVPDGGGDSASAILEVHHDLTRTAEYHSVVCRVDGTPADAPCQSMPPADAYWGLYWSDGDGGWTYSSQSVDALRVPDGGSVAFAWQDGGTAEQPGVAPPQNAPEPSPSPTPSSGGNGGGGAGASGGTSPTQSASPAADPSGSPTGADASGAGGASGQDRLPGNAKGQGKDKSKEKAQGKSDRDRGKGGRSEKADPSEDASTTPTDDPSDAVPVADPPTVDDGLAPWVAPAAIAGLFALAGVVGVVRRRSTG